MMQFDQIPYIFGSFSRRRHSTAETMPNSEFITHCHSKYQPVQFIFTEHCQVHSETGKKNKTLQSQQQQQRPKSFGFNNDRRDFLIDEQRGCNAVDADADADADADDEDDDDTIDSISLNQNDFVCKYCKNIYHEPKVLPCLHSFCTKCLNELINLNQEQQNQNCSNSSDKIDSSNSNSSSGGGCSGKGDPNVNKNRNSSDTRISISTKTITATLSPQRPPLPLLLPPHQSYSSLSSSIVIKSDKKEIRNETVNTNVNANVEPRDEDDRAINQAKFVGKAGPQPPQQPQQQPTLSDDSSQRTSTISSKDFSESSSLPTTNTNEIVCPTCNRKFQLPFGGIKRLPPDFILQNRILLASINHSSTQLLCDLCSNNVLASNRCNYCLINLCNVCSDAHKRQRFTWQHKILTLEEARKVGIKKIRRQIMCIIHPDSELKFFCVTCCQVTCRECNKTLHRDHRCDNVSSKYAQLYTLKIRQAVERTRPIVQQAPSSLERFHLIRKKIQSRCNAIKNEIETFMDAYIRAVEQHRQMLLLQVDEIYVDKIKSIEKQQQDLKLQAKDTEDAIKFVDSLLKEGTDIEILTFVKPILKKLEYCRQFGNLLEPMNGEIIEFLPREIASEETDTCPLYGIIVTQKIDPSQCIFYNSNNNNKNWFRPKKTIEFTLETRDSSKRKLLHGGEKIDADIKYQKEWNQKSPQIQITDCRNGLYLVTFVADYPGKLLLSIRVHGQHVKDSPQLIVVRPSEPHTGIFHCCTFCSFNGNRDVSCGCGSKMPGGYNGCGHGHDGHPGKRHWSCCGNTSEHSECKRITSKLYQISL